MLKFRLCSQLLVATGLFLSAVGCCRDEEPCERGDSAASSLIVRQGIAGVSYYMSDVISDGCRSCNYVPETLYLWSFDEDPRASGEAARVLMEEQPADQTLSIESFYERGLESAFHLLCTEDDYRSVYSCVIIDLGPNELWTVHVIHSFGGGAIRTFLPSGDETRELYFMPPTES